MSFYVKLGGKSLKGKKLNLSLCHCVVINYLPHRKMRRVEQSRPGVLSLSPDDDIHVVCGKTGAAPQWSEFPGPLVGPGAPRGKRHVQPGAVPLPQRAVSHRAEGLDRLTGGAGKESGGVNNGPGKRTSG